MSTYIQLGDLQVTLANDKIVTVGLMATLDEGICLTVEADYRGVRGYAVLTETFIQGEAEALAAIADFFLLQEACEDLAMQLNELIYSLAL